MRHTAFLSTIILAVSLIAACEHSKTLAPEAAEPTLSNIQNTIFSQKCATSGCHVPGGNGPMPMRTSQESFSNLVGVPASQSTGLNRVTSGDPDNSYLLQKLEGAPGIQGERMPLGGAALAGEQIELIRDWISTGAANN